MSQITNLNHAIFPPGTVVATLTGNVGGPIGPSLAQNINLVGGPGVVVTGNPVTNTLTITTAGGAGTVDQLTTNVGGPVLPVANSIGILGAVNQITTTGTNAPGVVTIGFVENPIVGGVVVATGFSTENNPAEYITLENSSIAAFGTNPNVGITLVTQGTGTFAVTADASTFTGTVSATDITADSFITVPIFGATLNITGNTLTGTAGFSSAAIIFETQGFGTILQDISVGYTGSGWNTDQRGVQTINATPTVIITVGLPVGQMITIKAYVNGLQSTFANSCGAEVLITAFRPTAGNVTLVGNEVITLNTTSTSTVTAGVDVGSQTVRVYVTGVAAQTWNWVTTYSYFFTITNA